MHLSRVSGADALRGPLPIDPADVSLLRAQRRFEPAPAPAALPRALAGPRREPAPRELWGAGARFLCWLLPGEAAGGEHLRHGGVVCIHRAPAASPH
eukprot:gene3710-10582_t